MKIRSIVPWVVAASALVPALQASAELPPGPASAAASIPRCLLEKTTATPIADVADDTIAVDEMTKGSIVVAGKGSSSSPAHATGTQISFNLAAPASWNPFPPPYCVNGTCTNQNRHASYFYKGPCDDPQGLGPTEVVDFDVGTQTKLPSSAPYLKFFVAPLPAMGIHPYFEYGNLEEPDLALPGECNPADLQDPSRSPSTITCHQSVTGRTMSLETLAVDRCAQLSGIQILAFRPAGATSYQIVSATRLGGQWSTMSGGFCGFRVTTSQANSAETFTGSTLAKAGMIPWAPSPSDYADKLPSMQPNQPGTYRLIAEIDQVQPTSSSYANGGTLVRQWPIALAVTTSSSRIY